jgi:hypothetical protein
VASVRRALLLPLAAVLALALPATASACSCAQLPEAERFRAADGAFTGTLISRHALDPSGGVESSGDPFVHQYRVERRYKGRRLFRTVWVRTVRDEATCGLPTRKRVALYLDRVNGHWESGLCDVTTRRVMRRAASSFTSRSQPLESALQQGFCPSSKAKGLLE